MSTTDIDGYDYPADHNIYRVEFMDGGEVEVLCFAPMFGDTTITACKKAEALPEWMQKRLAVLLVMEYDPPTKIIKGIGRRIDKNVFWVFKPDDEENDDG